MPKKILLIENDAAFAGTISGALEAAGYATRVAADGKDGLDLARDAAPDAIVLCVELPGMSGYLVCQKLRKDDALKSIPLVITSAEATQATFENHRKLKVRADEYLLKPYAPAALLETLARLVGAPEPPAAGEVELQPGGDEPALELGLDPRADGAEDEELVTLEEEVGIEALGGDAVGDLPALDLHGLPDGDSSAAPSSDEELRLLDDAFDGLAAPPSRDADDADPGAALDLALGGERPVDGLDLDAATASLPEDREARDRIDRLGDEADALLGALDGPDLDPGPAFDDERPASRPTLRTSAADVLRAALGRGADEAPPAPTRPTLTPPPAAAPAAASARLERELADAQAALAAARDAASGREAELSQLRDRVASLTERAGEAERETASLRRRAESLNAELDAARADASEARGAAATAARKAAEGERRAGDAEARAEDAGRRAAEAEAALRRKDEELQVARAASGRVEALERELEEARTEVLVARSEADGARGEVEARTAELRRRVQELEAVNAKNEERILKAYQKIKGDEKVREKLRKAIAIAGQLLDEGLPAESPAAERARAALTPRE
jgi:CheY-like chemotaxis protein